ncbi:FAD-dependent oxidoreductase, partial [bacterium]|nr:FAD-dependent oxidoreductase [bacterium]
MSRIWLEAEGFDELGGWVIDQQSMAQMGSAYVMAHGMGVPVRDAQTLCAVPEAGEYVVWVRTRDWTAVWGRGTPGGTFQVSVDGALLPETLGTKGVDWAWQKAGTVSLSQGPATIALHDLTGFNGRCDALYLTTDAGDVPPDEAQTLDEFRRAAAGIVCQEDPDVYDLAVAGGGMAGICTAIAAARCGAKVVLIQDRPVMGGCNSSEIRVPLGGEIHIPPYPALGKVVEEIAPIT